MHVDVIHWIIESQNYTKIYACKRTLLDMVVTPVPVSNHLIRIFYFYSFLRPLLKISLIKVKAKHTFSNFEIRNIIER